MAGLTNDDLELVPRTTFDGTALDLGLPGLRVGTVEYDEGPTGVTALVFDRPVEFSVDVRGGDVGVMGTTGTHLDAIALAGGAALGCEAIAGVATELCRQRGIDPSRPPGVPRVGGAVIFDFKGPARTAVFPDVALGRAAVAAAVDGRVFTGARGAGRSARCGGVTQDEPAGLAAASVPTPWGGQVAVVVLVNAYGVVVDRAGQVVRGNGRRPLDVAGLEAEGQALRAMLTASQNTTLTVVITDHQVSGHRLTMFGRQVHAGLSRAIRPFHTVIDGDVLWTVSTGEAGPVPTHMALGELATETAWDALLAM